MHLSGRAGQAGFVLSDTLHAHSRVPSTLQTNSGIAGLKPCRIRRCGFNFTERIFAADAILHAAEHPVRDLYVGGAARIAASSAHYAPRLVDKVLNSIMFNQQRTKKPASDRSNNSLYAPSQDMHEQQGHDTHVFKSSLYTKAVTNPIAGSLAMAGAGLALVALWQARRGRQA